MKLKIAGIILIMGLMVLQAAERKFMWQADVNGKKIFLVGSIHMMKKEFYPLPKIMDEAAEQSDIFIFETDLDAGGTDELTSFMLHNSMYQDGTTLDMVLADSTFSRLSAKLEEIGLDINKHLVYKPWYLSLIYTLTRYRQMGFSEHLGIDRYFFNLAEKFNKEIFWLEEPLQQMKIVLALSEMEPNQLISQTIKESETYEYNLENLFNLWKSGSCDDLAELIFSSYEDSPEVLDTLVLNRNRNWCEQIKEYCKDEKSYFIVVGAGHLVGEGSLIELLNKNGLKLSQSK